MSAATPSTENSTSSTSRSRIPSEASRSRFAWCITGSGHFLEESIALAVRLPQLDLFLSDAAEEVLPMYGMRIESLRDRFGPGFRLVRY